MGGGSSSTVIVQVAWQEVFGKAAAANHASGGLVHISQQAAKQQPVTDREGQRWGQPRMRLTAKQVPSVLWFSMRLRQLMAVHDSGHVLCCQNEATGQLREMHELADAMARVSLTAAWDNALVKDLSTLHTTWECVHYRTWLTPRAGTCGRAETTATLWGPAM